LPLPLSCLAADPKVFNKIEDQVLSIGLYLVMGWLILVALKPMLTLVPAPGLLWLFTGGIGYTLGVALFATDRRLRYGHFIWHVFVLAGTICQCFAVWYAV
jgi:hemolysin III